jgi:hypothetical protein
MQLFFWIQSGRCAIQTSQALCPVGGVGGEVTTVGGFVGGGVGGEVTTVGGFVGGGVGGEVTTVGGFVGGGVGGEVTTVGGGVGLEDGRVGTILEQSTMFALSLPQNLLPVLWLVLTMHCLR